MRRRRFETYPFSHLHKQVFTLKHPLYRVECWNFSDDSWADFAAGEQIQIDSAYPPDRATIRWSGCIGELDEGRPVWHKDGSLNPSLGYRFIVPNADLAAAIGFHPNPNVVSAAANPHGRCRSAGHCIEPVPDEEKCHLACKGKRYCREWTLPDEKKCR